MRFFQALWAKLVVSVFAVAILGGCTTTYLGRLIAWNLPDIDDYRRFPSRAIANSPPPFRFRSSDTGQRRFRELFGTLTYRRDGEVHTEALEEVLEKSGTTAFIVIQNDTVLYERYFNGYDRDSINTSFSVAKSIVSALVGIAVGEGLIDSIDDPVIKYVPELGTRVRAITLRHLLLMASGLKYSASLLPWADMPQSYYAPNQRQKLLRLRSREEPGQHFLYDDRHTQMLGLILERVTGRPVSLYLQEKIWKPLGMEYPASWSLDSDESGFELMFAGINAHAIDYAKIGRLYLRGGMWEGERIIPSGWVRESTAPITLPSAPEQYYRQAVGPEFLHGFFEKHGGYYSLHWWGYSKEDGGYDYFAQGALGQYLYLSPSKGVIIVRHGSGWGKVGWWPALFKEVAERLQPADSSDGSAGRSSATDAP